MVTVHETLDEIKSRSLVCTSCGLCERRTHVVFGEGNFRAPLVLVGEGPGEEEDKTGRPFVGRSGKLLDQALLDNGLTREHVYICNTVKCRAADWSSGKPMNRPPTEEESLACRQWLVPQLSAISPKVVLCVGAPSARNLIRKDFKITAERGRYFPSDFARAIMATLHPSYVLRQMHVPGDQSYQLLVADIHKAWDAAIRLRDKGDTAKPCEAVQMGLEL